MTASLTEKVVGGARDKMIRKRQDISDKIDDILDKINKWRPSNLFGSESYSDIIDIVKLDKEQKILECIELKIKRLEEFTKEMKEMEDKIKDKVENEMKEKVNQGKVNFVLDKLENTENIIMNKMKKMTGKGKEKCDKFLHEIKETKDKIKEKQKEKWFGGADERIDEILDEVCFVMEIIDKNIEQITDVINKKITKKMEKAQENLKKICEKIDAIGA